MSGANTPRSKKRIRQELIYLLKEQKSGKTYITPMLRIQIIRLLGVVDGIFPPNSIVLQSRDKPGRPPSEEVEEAEYDPEVQKLRKSLEEQHGHSNGNGGTGPTV